MGVKYPSQVYLESHMVNHINLTLSEDPVVKEAVTCQLEREGAWKKKSSTAVQCQAIFDQIAQTTAIPFQENCPNAHTKRLQTKKVKAVGKKLITEMIGEESNAKADKLESQGAVARLLAEEKKDIPWQSVIFAVPKGVMAWAARATTNCLASPDNLAKWKKIVDPKCPLCSASPCTLGHLLSNCKESLDRFEWRHNNIVHFLYTTFSSQRLEGVELFADLEGLRVNGVTVPPDLALTAQKPDLVIIKRGTKEVFLVELTVPWDCSSNMAAAVQRKSERYQGLASAIEENGFKCFNTPLEIGTRGVINSRNRAVLNRLCLAMKVKKISNLITTCSKLALLGSYTLWNARYSTDWNSGGYLKP